MEKINTSKLQILRRYFETMSMKDSQLVDSFYTHVIGPINRIKSHGETIEDRKFVEKVLRSLPPKLDTLVVTLERKDLSQRTDKSNIECHQRKKCGNYAYECKKRQYNQNKQGQVHSNSENNQTNPMFMVRTEVMPILSQLNAMLLNQSHVTYGIQIQAAVTT